MREKYHIAAPPQAVSDQLSAFSFQLSQPSCQHVLHFRGFLVQVVVVRRLKNRRSQRENLWMVRQVACRANVLRELASTSP
jgi:hypothetical protein